LHDEPSGQLCFWSADLSTDFPNEHVEVSRLKQLYKFSCRGRIYERRQIEAIWPVHALGSSSRYLFLDNALDEGGKHRLSEAFLYKSVEYGIA
jgi:hypothetical protein